MSTTQKITLKSLAADAQADRETTAAMFATIMARLDTLAPVTATVVEAVTEVQAPAKADEPNEFVAWLADTAEARKARKASNADMAAWLRSKGLPTGGSVWDACKKGERSVRTLKRLAAADKAARKA